MFLMVIKKKFVSADLLVLAQAISLLLRISLDLYLIPMLLETLLQICVI